MQEQEQEQDPSKVTVEMNILPDNKTLSESLTGGEGGGRALPNNAREGGIMQDKSVGGTKVLTA